jgi:regulatory protein
MDNRIWNKILNYCAYRERSENEILRKLYEWGIKEKKLQYEYLKNLIENGIVSDRKYIEAYVRGKIRMNKWGPQKLIFELSKKGFKIQEIERNIKLFEAEIHENCLHILRSGKFKKLLSDETNEVKIKRYLYGKGYPPEMITKCLEEIKQNHEN